ncbi:MAG: DUF2000 family protein [Pseudomonadota bacterium]
MEFDTKFAIVVADDLLTWQKLNVVAFLSSGVVGGAEDILGEPYMDGSRQHYAPLCIQPIVILKTSRERLRTFLDRANRRGVAAAVYIEDMFATGHDGANRETVARYSTDALPLVGMAARGDRKEIDKICKGAKLHD